MAQAWWAAETSSPPPSWHPHMTLCSQVGGLGSPVHPNCLYILWLPACAQ
jgi:hypothetical protein